MTFFETFWLPFTWLIGAVILDLIANWALVKSQGFTVIKWSICSIAFVSAAFGCMAQAVLVMPLSIAYALWSVMGIFGTIFIGKFFFKQYLSKQKYCAIALLAIGIVLMNMA